MATATFDDPELFRSGISAAWAELVLTGSGRFRATHRRAALSGTHAQQAGANLAHVLLVGVTDRAVIHVAPAEEGALVLNGRTLRSGELALCPPGGEVHLRSAGGVAWNTLSFAIDDFAAATAKQLGEPVGLPRQGLRVVRPRTADMARLEAMRSALLENRCPIGEAIQAQTLDAASACFDGSADVVERLAERRARDLVAALERIASEAHDLPLTITELCARLGVPARTLNTACHTVLGIGAARYLRGKRLLAVRRALLEQTASVTEAATAQGFWELGRFAGIYRATFGESPSMTVMRRAQRKQRGT